MMSRTWKHFSKLLPEPSLERRLHKRAVLYWARTRGTRPVPTVEAFDPSAIEDDLSHGFMLDLRGPGEPTFTAIGPVLEQEAALNGSPVPYDAVSEDSLLKRFARHFPRVLESGSPETAEYDFVTPASYHVLCRGALLPLSSDGRTIDHVYGVISWKSQKIDASAGEQLRST